MKRRANHIGRLLIVLALLTSLFACKKGPGPGGQCSISGKVFAHAVKNVGFTHYTLDTSYYAGAENVFISYGDEPGVGQTVRTAEDGSFLFEYLLPGKYKVYAVSRDTNNKFNNVKRVVTLQEIEITGRRDQIILEDLVILK